MFFSGLFQRKSDAPVTTPAELADAIGLSYDTYTGKQISSQRAMRLTAVFSCVRVLAESVGMLPCNLYHLNGNLKQRATGERLHKLISTHPNGYMTPQEFWELVVTCLCLRGNFYAYKVKAFGEVAELLPVDPGCVVTEFAEQEEIAFTTGDGTKKPKGFLAYESTDETDKVRAFGKLQHIVSGEATAVTADAIIKLIYTLRKAHRTGAKFMMNNNSLFAIRLLKDSEGNYLWRPGLELGQPSSLAGYGIAENEQMPDIAADAKAIAFGNFKRGYTIVDRIGTRILRDPYTNKPFVGFYTTKRTGGMLVDSQAIKLLKIAAA
ncbi:phage major capsid protein [Escherichia coli]|uniref:phage major capsid protein n=1 Tax=Escherichia coli TaxID=562 RepID=UPI000B7D97C2|nr:phage major capsid protein [Escherichia coli]MBB2277020.1 phage major capsid protein [Escherichia coli]